MKAADKAASQILAQLFVGSSEAQAAGMPDVTNVVTFLLPCSHSCFHALFSSQLDQYTKRTRTSFPDPYPPCSRASLPRILAEAVNAFGSQHSSHLRRTSPWR